MVFKGIERSPHRDLHTQELASVTRQGQKLHAMQQVVIITIR